MADVTQLRGKLSAIKSIDKRHLISRTEWGNIDFSGAAKSIDSIYEIVDLLSDLPLERLPTSAVEQVSASLDRVTHWIAQNNSFNLQNPNPSGVRDDIVNNMAVQEQDLYNTCQQWIPFLAYLKGDIPQQLSRITTSVGQAETAFTNFDKYAGDKRTEIDKIVQAAREASSEAGVGAFTEDFLRDAEGRDAEAKTWLISAAIATVVTVIVAVVFFFVRAPENQYALIQFSTSKLVILAMLIGISAWCAGNFKANKHQASVSRYKAHALKTFQAFVQASDNPSVKDAVLMETTRAIFAQNQTGYLKGDVPSEGSSRIVEIFKGNTDAAAS